MNIVGYKSGGHDGSVCSIKDGKLIFSIEGEKDNHKRHEAVSRDQFDKILARWGEQPDIICGDSYKFGSEDVGLYTGISFNDIQWSKVIFDGKEIDYAAVPHELAHITSAIALSDLPEGQACYALVWEGFLGRFYYVDENLKITKLGKKSHVLNFPGVRYIMPYHGTGKIDMHGHSAAGKIMAIAGMGKEDGKDYSQEIEIAHMIVSSIFDHDVGRVQLDGDWHQLYSSLAYLRGVPVDDPRFIALCRAMQDAIFEVFHQFAVENIDKKLPLVISGGCGLNCEWNTQWHQSGLFTSVFVPPVTNDTGIAIGAATAIQFLKTGKIKIEWDVYAGENFVHETGSITRFGYDKYPLDFGHLTKLLYEDEQVIAWIRGRYEIGPRALCHRSLIASPLSEKTRDKLNKIKKREYFRPVAPVCLEEDVGKYFEWEGPSPYMLFFQKVRTPELRAVTHFDNTARVQTINAQQEPVFHQLLTACKEKSGYGVLCNTSLNFPGNGFINRTSDILNYVDQTDMSVFVIDDWIYIKNDKNS